VTEAGPGTQRKRSVLVLSVMCVVLGVAALRATAFFDGSASDSHSTTSANLTISTSGSSFTTDAEGLTPGASATRAITLDLDGTGDFGAVKLTTTATASSALDTDATDGLQVQIDRCSVAWSGSEDDYTCSGSASSVLADRAVVGSNLTLSNLDVSPNAHNRLVVTLSLPNTADASFESLSSTLQFTFTGHQRTAGAR
jgi:hypothetical protein